jgi:hypothetical protein
MKKAVLMGGFFLWASVTLFPFITENSAGGNPARHIPRK